MRELFEAVDEVVHNPSCYAPTRPEIRADHREALAELGAQIGDAVPAPYPPDWVALKLFEGDRVMTDWMQRSLPPEKWDAVREILAAHEDGMMAVASGRYEWIGRMTRAAMRRPAIGQIGLTARLDRVLAHPLWGVGVLLAILGVVFWLTYTVAAPLQTLLEVGVGAIGAAIDVLFGGALPWLSDLLVNGLLAGVGTVITFVPILIIFFTAMGVLEETGYMARAAFVMDRFMHLIGLHGKSFLPLFLGFGCNVPAVMGARVIEAPKARLLTIMLAPLVPCTARLAVLAFLAPAFFGRSAAVVAWGLVALALLVLVVAGFIVDRVAMRGENAAFIMELPLFHVPTVRAIGLLVWQRTLSFLQKAATIMVAASLGVWALSYFPGPGIEHSYMAAIGQVLAPAGRLVGLNWQLVVALLTSVIAKENSVATLGILYGASGTSLAHTLAGAITPASALAYLVVQLMFVPCVATMAVIRQEAGWRWMALNLLFLLVVSLGVGGIVYAVASMV